MFVDRSKPEARPEQRRQRRAAASMLKTTTRAVSVAVVLVSMLAAVGAQDLGRGSLASNGVEPTLKVASASAGKLMSFTVEGLPSPATPNVVALFLLSPTKAEIPFVHGAVIGLDLAALVVSAPVPVDARGTAKFELRVDPAWDGFEVHVQCVVIDDRVQPPFVMTDSRALVVGTDDPELVLARDAGGGLVDVVRVRSDGRAGVTLGALRGLALLDLDMASISELRRFTPGVSRPCVVAQKRAVQLADGSTLFAARSNTADLVLRAHASGRVEVVASFGPFSLQGVVAAGAEHVALLEGLVPRLWIYRTSGNFKGSNSALRDATPSGGVVIEPMSLCMGARVLALSDKARGVYLVPLDGGAATRAVLPPSGGRSPVFHDEEIARSGDGRVFAFGAGSDKKVKDIYVLRDDGAAVNVTQRATDYQEVGYGNIGRRTEIELNHDGSIVSYVDDGGQEPEGYVTPVTFPNPVHITTTRAFVDSIDIGSTSRFPVKGGGIVFAGLDEASIDVFFTPALRDHDIRPLTNTANATAAPWGLGAKLSIVDMGSTSTQESWLLQARRQGALSDEVWWLEPGAQRGRVLSRAFAGRGAALPTTQRVLLEDQNGVVIADLSQGTAATLTLGTGSVQALSSAPGQAVVALTFGAPSAQELFVVDGQGGSQRLAASLGAAGDVLAFHASGQVHLLSAPGVKGRALLRWRASDQLQQLGADGFVGFLQVH